MKPWAIRNREAKKEREVIEARGRGCSSSQNFRIFQQKYAFCFAFRLDS